MVWTVLGEEKGKIKLVSKNEVSGMLPKGSYLTIEEGETKFILRVDNSLQHESYAPSPMLIDMNLSPLKQDQKCQNIVMGGRIVKRALYAIAPDIRIVISEYVTNAFESVSFAGIDTDNCGT